MNKEKLAPDVVKVVDALTESPEFKYLRAYVNTTKHYSLVDVTHQISLKSSTPRYGVQILSFEYRKERFPAKWADDFVVQDFRVIKENIIRVGIELNTFLKGVAGI